MPFPSPSTHAPYLLKGTVASPPTEEGQADADRPQINWDFDAGTWVLTFDGKTINIDFSHLPAGAVAQFREVNICDGGAPKIAYVLMTLPVEA